MSGLVMGFETKLRNEVSDMAREIFEVTKDRFHLKDPCRYILQGTWPKEAKMRACLDGSQIKAEIRKLEVVSALERFKDPDLMRGERITAEVRLPESLEGFQKLTVYADMPEKTINWFSVSVKELERRRGKPQFFIEEEKVQQGFLRIRGWTARCASRSLMKTSRRFPRKSSGQSGWTWSSFMRRWIFRIKRDFSWN